MDRSRLTYTAATTVNGAATTSADIERIKAALEKLGPEPIGEWMRSQGFPPESSVLVMPEASRSNLPLWPSYVLFSKTLRTPVLCALPLPSEFAP